MKSRHLVSLCAIGLIGLGAPAPAQNLPALTGPEVRIGTNSGWVKNGARSGGAVVVYTTDVRVPGATWLRLTFSDITLGGTIEGGNASYLKITSLADGAFMLLNAKSAAEWSLTSAYMNGEAVQIELLAYPGTGNNRVAVASATAGQPQPINYLDTICGPTDDRLPSSDPRAARVSTGCSGWLINDKAKGFLSAGHCNVTGTTVMMFNVPFSTAGGGLVNPPPQDQYVVNAASIQKNTGTTNIGNDHVYYGTAANSTTGKTAFEAQGAFYTLATSVPPVAGTIRITGYGTTSAPISPTWNQIQKTHTGPFVNFTGGSTGVLHYATDTTGGNSGSAVEHVESGLAIGIHGYVGCTSTGGSNRSGSSVNHTHLQQILANPTGILVPTWANCYADCNKDGMLNIADFGCFQTKFATGDPSANCNGDVFVPNPVSQPFVWAPKLDIADFGCFQTKFALGCP